MDDWPLMALSMTLDCPVRTEDQDFFGTGVATWRLSHFEPDLVAADQLSSS